MAHFGPRGAAMAAFEDEEQQNEQYPHFSASLAVPQQNDVLFNHPTVLNHEEQEFMDQFWNNPNNNFNRNMMFDNNELADAKTNGLSGRFGHNDTTLHNSLTTNPGANYATRPMASKHVKSSVGHMTGPSPSDSDYAAASSLFGMTGQGFAPASNGNTSGASTWGQLNVPSSNPMHMKEVQSQVSSGTPSANYTPTTPTNQSFNLQFQQTANPELMHYLHLQQQGDSRGRQNPLQYSPGISFFADQRYPRMPLSDHSHPQTQDSKPVMHFGSDHGFTSSGFLGPLSSQVQDKGNNLLNVPFANQAIGNEHAQLQGFVPLSEQRTFQRHNLHDMSGIIQRYQSSPHGFGGVPFNPPPSASQHDYLHGHIAARSIENEHDKGITGSVGHNSRKRHLSNLESDDDAEPSPARGQRRISSSKAKAKMPKVEHADDNSDSEYREAALSSKPSKMRRKTSSPVRQASDSLNNTSPSAVASESPLPSGSKKKSSDAKSRQNLSENQKRDNHIKSEQRRRNLIKDEYSEIERLVPSLKLGKSGLSKSDALFETVKFIEKLASGNAKMEERFGIHVEVVYHFDNDEAIPKDQHAETADRA